MINLLKLAGDFEEAATQRDPGQESPPETLRSGETQDLNTDHFSEGYNLRDELESKVNDMQDLFPALFKLMDSNDPSTKDRTLILVNSIKNMTEAILDDLVDVEIELKRKMNE